MISVCMGAVASNGCRTSKQIITAIYVIKFHGVKNRLSGSAWVKIYEIKYINTNITFCN